MTWLAKELWQCLWQPESSKPTGAPILQDHVDLILILSFKVCLLANNLFDYILLKRGPFVHKAISQAIDKQSGVYRLPKDQKKFAPRNADKAVSVDAPLSANNPYTLLDILNDPDVKIADDTLNIEMMKKKMAESIADLLPREKEIITKFYGIGVPKETMAEIAEDMGLKRERVRQIRNLTIRRLNRSIRHQALRNYFKR